MTAIVIHSSLIWKIKTPHKIRYFLCSYQHGRLLTNHHQLHNIGLINFDVSSFCGQTKEDNNKAFVDFITKISKDNLEKSQRRMKFYADNKRTKREFVEGDWVFLKLYIQASVAIKKILKLASKLYGPYQIIKKMGALAYKVRLPATAKIHPVFRISQFKKKIGRRKVVPSTDPPICFAEGQPLIEPIVALERRIVKKGNKAATQILVEWANLLPEEATWEDYNFIKYQFPSLILERARF